MESVGGLMIGVDNMQNQAKDIKDQILELTKKYYIEQFGDKEPYRCGERVNYAGRVFDDEELCNLVDASLEFWLTAGRYAEEFEKGFAEYMGVKYCSLVNSGSSANLLAFMALTSPLLGDRRIRKGDEVITVAAGFPTTISPVIQYGAIPVFVDVTIPQYNIDVRMLKDALSDRTRAVFAAHTLGNPFELEAVRSFCDEHGLWLIEDNCDALGSEYMYRGEWRKTGTVGHLGTSSFYPPHHMTMGEGGAVYTQDPILYKIVNSLRDWGRDCFCKSGQDGRCMHRFDRQYGELPFGYDHKFVYSHFGYNLKATDLQAAVGCAQLKKLDRFTDARRKNWEMLRKGLEPQQEFMILPEAEQSSRPSWFGFLLTIRENAGFTRDELAVFLEQSNIQTRNLFAGNIIKHPCFDEMRADNAGYRVAGTLENTDCIMGHSLWVGVYPGMEEGQIKYMIDKITQFVQER